MIQFMYGITVVFFLVAVANAEPPAEQSNKETIPLDQVGAFGEALKQNSTTRRFVSLPSIVTTSPQEELLNTRRVFTQEADRPNNTVANKYLRRILLAAQNGASNMFLVDAENAHDAIAASSRVLIGSHGAGSAVPINTPNPVGGSYWLVAYLGSGPSNPTWWVIENVTIQKDNIRLAYRQTKPNIATRDIHQYFYWVPLGVLEPGTYRLELYDAKKDEITLLRRVEVGPIN